MPTNYKLLYEQMRKMVEMYQDEIVPQMREMLDKRVEVVRCKDCKHLTFGECYNTAWDIRDGSYTPVNPNDFCSYGEREEDTK